MSIKAIKFVGPVMDHSGYGAASRANILSIHKKGFPICVEPHCFERNQTAVGSVEDRQTMDELISKASSMEYDAVVSQLTPDIALMHREPGKYNISYFAWELSVVHPKWVECLNLMDEIWIPSDWNITALKNSGVRKPIFKVPHGIELNKFDSINSNTTIPGIDTDTFKFYSIFQWQPRKNPEALLRAYFNAFTVNDNVVLVLKTYFSQGGQQEQNSMIERIKYIKKDMLMPSYPRVVLITDVLPGDQILSLHKSMDCFVSMSHSEGWGLTPFEAGLAGKPVIATGATGNMEFMTVDNSYPVDFQWEYTHDMSNFNRWYLGYGQWASPSEVHAAKLMRHVYNNRQEAKDKGSRLRERIISEFNYDKIADIMIGRLTSI